MNTDEQSDMIMHHLNDKTILHISILLDGNGRSNKTLCDKLETFYLLRETGQIKFTIRATDMRTMAICSECKRKWLNQVNLTEEFIIANPE